MRWSFSCRQPYQLLSNQFKHNQSPGITDIPSRLAANTLQPKEKSPSALSVPLRLPRELKNLRNPAILANLFSPKKFSQASENRAAGI
jgi:hypothetical protein